MAGTLGKGRRQTPEVLSAVCDGLRSGLPIKRAAMAAGISEKTFHNWRGDGWHSIEKTDQDSDAPMSFLLIHESHPAMSARYGMGWVRAAL